MSRSAMWLAAAVVTLVGLFTYAWVHTAPQPTAVTTLAPPSDAQPASTPQPAPVVAEPTHAASPPPVQVITLPAAPPEVRVVQQPPSAVVAPAQPHAVSPVPVVRAAIATPKPAPKPTQTGPLTTIDPGTYVVGTDVVAGTYKTNGPTGDSPCYWARLQDTSGSLESIITNGLPEGPTTVTISATDGAFETSRCATWQKIG